MQSVRGEPSPQQNVLVFVCLFSFSFKACLLGVYVCVRLLEMEEQAQENSTSLLTSKRVSARVRQTVAKEG